MRTISDIKTDEDWKLRVSFPDGAIRLYDMKPLLESEAFIKLNDPDIFKSVSNCSYFIKQTNATYKVIHHNCILVIAVFLNYNKEGTAKLDVDFGSVFVEQGSVTNYILSKGVSG